jgi:glycerol uptake facilitator protein
VAVVGTFAAFLAEAVGTFVLVFLIFSLTEGCNLGRPDDALAPLFIGLTVTVIIAILAPLTQAGLNPARDLSPRLFAALAGWGGAAFPDQCFGYLTVYVLGPLAGAGAASLTFTWLVEPLMRGKVNRSGPCDCRSQGL